MSTSRRAVFRVDASATIGSGHLARTMTLARALARVGFSSRFATHDPSEHTRRWVEREGHELVEVGATSEAARSAAEDADLVVLDGYAFGQDYHDALRAPHRVVCVVDDLGEAVRADAVLNGNFFAESLAYAGVDTRLLGPRYALVRDEFRQARRAFSDRHEPARVLFTMGGADPSHATELSLAALELLEGLEARVIVGGANPRANAIRASAARVRSSDVRVDFDVVKMSEPMSWCDVAVAAAGSTCLELACVGVPSIVVVVADNQEPVAAEVARRGLMTSVGRVETLAPARLAATIEALLADSAQRSAMVARQHGAIEGDGAERAASCLATLVERKISARSYTV